MNRPPLIGINCGLAEEGGEVVYRLCSDYANSVERAGGVPVLMPSFHTAAAARRFMEHIDGAVFTGGTDVNPRRWGERRHPKARLLHPEREKSDFTAIAEALRRDLPLLGICCGCQELNVALGGSIHQHLPDLPWARRHSGGVRHAAYLAPASRLREIMGTACVTVNSYHHQACRDLGNGLETAAYSPDGVVEAVESELHRFVIGIQWHPERMKDDRRQRALFKALVAEARLSKLFNEIATRKR